jgi:hypothetical protein
MRNAECGMIRNFFLNPHSAFRIPHSVFDYGIEIKRSRPKLNCTRLRVRMAFDAV